MFGKARTATALVRNFGRARVQPRHWRSSVRLAREAIGSYEAVQKPAELAPLIGLLAAQRPTTVLEIGTYRGGTLWVWCKLATANATIVSVDLPGGPFGGGGYDADTLYGFVRDTQRLRLIRGDSHAIETRAEAESMLGGPIDFLFIDGDHSYEGVRLDYALYSPLVREGGLIALHDIVPGPSEYVGGVPRFWQEVECIGKREIIDDLGSGGSAIEGGFGIGLVTWKPRTSG